MSASAASSSGLNNTRFAAAATIVLRSWLTNLHESIELGVAFLLHQIGMCCRARGQPQGLPWSWTSGPPQTQWHLQRVNARSASNSTASCDFSINMK
jgi:hypothetical protein